METFTSIVKTIWLADDDPDDLEVFQETLTEVYPSAKLNTFRNGNELLAALSTLPAPDLLFLDINMPCKGHDCLKAIRSEPKFQNLPLIIYSSSFRELDVTYSYGLGANLYVRKPSTYMDMLNLMEKLLQLDWTDPKEITNKQFVDDKYVPFTAL